MNGMDEEAKNKQSSEDETRPADGVSSDGLSPDGVSIGGASSEGWDPDDPEGAGVALAELPSLDAADAATSPQLPPPVPPVTREILAGLGPRRAGLWASLFTPSALCRWAIPPWWGSSSPARTAISS